MFATGLICRSITGESQQVSLVRGVFSQSSAKARRDSAGNTAAQG
jgi:hypothetical protein